jgi:hypothetical protein
VLLGANAVQTITAITLSANTHNDKGLYEDDGQKHLV